MELDREPAPGERLQHDPIDKGPHDLYRLSPDTGSSRVSVSRATFRL